VLHNAEQQDVPAEILELTARTSSRLRADGNAVQALALSIAGNRRTAELRMEEAVAAFACGEDDRVRELASLDPEVETMIEPWLAAIEGGRVPNAPAAATPTWRAILAVCRTVSALVQGRGVRTRTALTAVKQPERGRLFVSELLDVSALLCVRHEGPLERACASLARSTLVRGSPSLRATLAMTAASRSPRLFLDRMCEGLNLGEEATRDAAIHASCMLAGVEGPQAQVSQMIARLGADAFAPSERGNALLHEGFACSGSDSRRAQEAFNRAVALGGDMVEALRGRHLVARTAFTRVRAYDGEGHHEATRSLMSSGVSLAGHLQRDPAGGPLAVVALIDAATAAVHLGQDERAQELVSRMRELARTGGFLTEALAVRLDALEAKACQRTAPERCLRLVEDILARDARHHDAWHMKIDIISARDSGAGEELVLQAAEVKLCPELISQARHIHMRRGTKRALVPGQDTAGGLAAELLARTMLARATSASGPLIDPGVEACRIALGAEQRAAFDVASVVILGRNEQGKQAAQRARALVAEASSNVGLQSKILAAAILALDPASFSTLVVDSARDGAKAASIAAVHMLLQDDETRRAEAVIAKLAPMLTSAQLKELQTLVRRGWRGELPAGLPDAWKLVVGVDPLLAPDLSLEQLLDNDDDADDDEPFEDELMAEVLRQLKNHPRGIRGAMEQFLEAAGIPRSRLHSLGEQKRRAIEERFGEALHGPDAVGRFEALMEVLVMLGITVGTGGRNKGKDPWV